MDYVYKFPVVRGTQAGRDYYIAMVPLKMLSRLFPTDDEEFVSPEYRAQRRLNEARIPTISRYILDNKDTYVFSALAASIDGEFYFRPDAENIDIGVLEVSMDAKFMINDGQHRKSAILAALKEDFSLGEETISIVFYADKGLARSQQIFTDLNKNAVRTSNSISELYDSRDTIAVITRSVVQRIDFLNTYTDKEKDNLGKFSSSLFTLNTFYLANRIIVSNGADASSEDFIYLFWSTVTKHIISWSDLQNRTISKMDLRENYIITQNIVIQALARLGQYYYRQMGSDMVSDLKKLESVNWRRNADIWRMRAVAENGRIITNKRAAILICNHLKRKIGIPLSEDEKAAEHSLKNT